MHRSLKQLLITGSLLSVLCFLVTSGSAAAHTNHATTTPKAHVSLANGWAGEACSPSSADVNGNVTFPLPQGIDPPTNCPAYSYYTPGPKEVLYHYTVDLPPLSGSEYYQACTGWPYVPTQHASVQHARYDLFLNQHWLGWAGTTIDQNNYHGKSVQIGPYFLGSNVQGGTLEIVEQDEIDDNAGEMGFGGVGFVCSIVTSATSQSVPPPPSVPSGGEQGTGSQFNEGGQPGSN